MTTYQLAQVPNMTIGAGARRQIGILAASLVPAGASVLLAADPGLKATGMTEEVVDLLEAAGFSVEVFSEIYLGKAVAAIAGAAAPAETYALCAAPLPAARLRTICMPTTAGTGSETTRTAILSGADGAKLWFWGNELKADHALLDPELTRSLPPHLTAATGIDALVHAVEAATNRNANPGNDLYAHAALRLVATHLEAAVADPSDIQAREAVQRAAALAGTAIDNCGTAIGHAIGHAMASLRPIHHGRAVGIAMLASLPWTVADDPNGRFAACAAAMGAEPTGQGFIDAFGRLVRETGMRVAVREDFAGIDPGALAAQMVRPENMPMIRSTRRDASSADLRALSEAVLALA